MWSRGGGGGEEPALFAGDLLRMYLRFAEGRGWRTEVLDANESDLGGYKPVTVAVKAKGSPGAGGGPARGRRAAPDANESGLGGYKSVTVAVKAKGTPEPGEAPHALLKYEAGVHRVQRVTGTEPAGRSPR